MVGIPVTFDGTNDWLSRGGALSPQADGQQLSGSVWIRPTTFTGERRLLRMAGGWASIRLVSGTNELNVAWANTAGPPSDVSISTSAITTTAWYHIMWSYDTTDTAKRHMYVNDVSDLTVNTWTASTILEFNISGTCGIGASDVGADKYAGDMADFWLAPGQYIDLSVEANRRKFITSTGGWVDLGTDGSTPTGVAPSFFFSGATDTWHTNDGTGGGFTENGALTDGTVPLPAASASLILPSLSRSMMSLLAR